jgi:hypothetical protein
MKTFFIAILVLLGCTLSRRAPAYQIEWQKYFGNFSGAVAIDSSGDVFVAGSQVRKFDTSGNELWSRPIGGEDIALDLSGNAYIASNRRMFGATNASVSKLDGMGDILWTTQIGTLHEGYSSEVAVDRFGSVYVTGYTGTIIQGYNAFLTMLDNSGAVAWTKQFGTATHNSGNGVATDAAGNRT